MLNNKVSIIFEDSRYGGPHSQFCNLISALKRKIKFNLLISNKESVIFEEKLKRLKIKYKKEKIHFLTLERSNFLMYIFLFFYELSLIIKFLNKNNCSYIYIPGGSSCIKSVIAGLILKKKILWHIHDVHSNFLLRLSYFFLSLFVWKIIFASEKSFKFYPNFFNKKKTKIIQSSVQKKYLYKKKIKRKKINVAMVANYNPIKNIELFLQIVGKFKNKNFFLFHHVGQVWNSQKEYYKKCQSIIKKKKLYNLKLYKNLNKNFYKKMDIFLCTSHSESSPLSLWEAMSVGIPVVSTDVGDLKKFNKKHKFAALIRNKNLDTFCKSIYKISLNKKMYLKMSKNSKIVYKKYFTIESYKESFLKLFN